MGAKIDNIYDLFDALPQIDSILARCTYWAASWVKANMISGSSQTDVPLRQVNGLGQGPSPFCGL